MFRKKATKRHPSGGGAVVNPDELYAIVDEMSTMVLELTDDLEVMVKVSRGLYTTLVSVQQTGGVPIPLQNQFLDAIHAYHVMVKRLTKEESNELHT